MNKVRTMRGITLASEVICGQVGEDMAPEAMMRWTRSVTDGFDRAMKQEDRTDARWFLQHASHVPGGRVPWRMRMRWWALIHLPALMRSYSGFRSRT